MTQTAPSQSPGAAEMPTLGMLLAEAIDEIDRLTAEVARLRETLRDAYSGSVASDDPDDPMPLYCSACGATWGDVEEHKSDCWLIALIGPRAALPEGTT